MRVLFLASLLAAPVPVSAGFLDFLFGSDTGIMCGVQDRSCLLAWAEAEATQSYTTREVARNTAPHALELAQIASLLPDDARTALRARLLEADDTASFFEVYDRSLVVGTVTNGITLTMLISALEARAAPDGSGFSDYVRRGFAGLLEGPERDAALDLWETRLDFLWSEAGGAVIDTHAWMARNDIARLERYSRNFNMPLAQQEGPYSMLATAAANQCATGDLTNGKRVLAVLRERFRQAPRDRIIRTYAQGHMFRAVLYCEGEEDANALRDNIRERIETAFAEVRETYADPDEQAFVMGAIQSGLALSTTQEMAYWLLAVQNRPEEARAVFEAEDSVGSGLASGTSDAAPGSENSTWDQFLRDVPVIALTGEDPGSVLRYYTQVYQAGMEDEFGEMQRLGWVMDAIDARWPAPPSPEAAAKVVEQARLIVAQNADLMHFQTYGLLRLAALPQPASCVLSDKGIKDILAEIPQYRFSSQKVMNVLLLVRYLDRFAVQEPVGAPCVFSELKW